MVKKKLKFGIAIFVILILLTIACYQCITKSTFLINAVNASKLLFAPNQTETDNSQITYNTAGNDTANHLDGDITKEKTEWIKNGDIWTYTFYVDDPNAEWYVYEDSSTLMEGYSGDYTEYNPDKLFTEETLDSFTPTDNMTASQNSDGKDVYTWLDSENSYKVIVNGDGTYTKITTKLSLTINNYKVGNEPTDPTESIKYGDLIIKKIVKNSQGTVLNVEDDSTSFIFTITLTADNNHKGLIEGTKVFGDVIFRNGVGTVSLKANENITISGIPAGLSYSVTERNEEGYNSAYDTKYYGIINENKPEVVTYINTQKNNEQPSGEEHFVNVTLKKIVVGNNEIDEKYSFEIGLNNLKPNTTYSLSNNATFVSDSTGSANLAVSLAKNETVTIQNIPVGSKYQIFEHAGDYISSYLITDANNMGSINNSENSNTKVNTSLATRTETADEGENITVTFTNQKIVTQNLKIQKIVTDQDNKNEYIFNIEFANMGKGQSFNSTVGKVTADSNGKAELSIYLAGGENAEFYEIPVGTTYKVTELASSSIASYIITDENNKDNIVCSTDSNDVAKKALETEVETVNQGEEVTVTFLNDSVNQGEDSVSASLGVIKKVVNSDGNIVENCDDEFSFEIIADDENNPMPEENITSVNGNGEASFGKITFNKVGTYTYKIVEKTGNSDLYTYDNSSYIVVYEITKPDGLLEISKTIKKNGLESDFIIFTNKLLKNEEVNNNTDEDDKTDEPDISKETEELDDTDDSDNVKGENEGKTNEDSNVDEGNKEDEPASPQTGDVITFTIIILLLTIEGSIISVLIIRRNGFFVE